MQQRSVDRERPTFIRHWSEIEREEPMRHWHTKDPMVRPAPFSERFALRRLGIRHDTIMPGWRSAPPHAERDEEEMVFILQGTPDLWVDGYLYRMKPGEAAGWPGRDGVAHCLINNTDTPVRMLTIGETSRWNSQINFPATPDIAEAAAKQGMLWTDPPARKLGPHDGKSDAQRGHPFRGDARTKRKPACVVDWKAILKPGEPYPGDKEKMADWSHFSIALGLTRIGVGHDFMAPGRRSSWPHAEYDEEEFVYVVEGEPDVWIDGWLHRLKAGDGVGFPDRTGIAHCFINNTDKPVRLIVAGEASRQRSKFFYPLHPKRNKQIGKNLWADPPKHKLGPHDGMPDRLRAALKKGRRRG